MKLTTRHNAILSGVFGVYLFLILRFFGITGFFETTFNHDLLLLVATLSMAGLTFVGLTISRKRPAHQLKWWYATAFLLPAFIVSPLLMMVASIDSLYLAAYFSGFLVVSFIPAVFVILYAVYLDAQLLLKRRLSVNVPTSQDPAVPAEALLTLENTKGRTRLEVPVSSIICFEANDNYVVIYFEDASGKLNKKMERLSMRRAEELISGYAENFIRAHKSFLVNKQFILDVKGRAQAYRLQVKHLDELIPVSRRLTIHEITG
jgi:DNA-binding LytR/AlgR family response regulator